MSTGIRTAVYIGVASILATQVQAQVLEDGWLLQSRGEVWWESVGFTFLI